MKTFVKNLYHFDNSTPPRFIGQREQLRCPKCDSLIFMAVPTTGIDWERVAKDYEKVNKKLWDDCNQILKEAGCDSLFKNQLNQLLKKLEDLI